MQAATLFEQALAGRTQCSRRALPQSRGVAELAPT
jgi:hypothetical protein